FFFFKQKTAYEMPKWLEFRSVLFRSVIDADVPAFGRTGAAAEGGHVSIDYNGPRCNCGKKGCIEVLASGTAIGKKARAKLAGGLGRKSAMLDLAGGDLDLVSSEVLGQAYAAGDPLAKEILFETVDVLAVWLGNIVD